MDNKPLVSNPNDFKVVEFFNSTNFDFTPELGAMYDGRPLFVSSGERKQFPYHIAHRLAENLAKAILVKGDNSVDTNSTVPTGIPLWSDEKVEQLKKSFLTELYSDIKPIVQTETDRLMARVTELENFVKGNSSSEDIKEENVSLVEGKYSDKQEVMAELDKREIKFDRRLKKEQLEKLLN